MSFAVDLSREQAAGYDPATLAQARVLAVGAGALGQSILSVLALSQIGDLMVVDFDEFEPSNAARSPFFPTLAEKAQLGNHKAAVVAHKLRERLFWSKLPSIRYANTHVQALGDEPFRSALVVVSAVDHDGAREYLSAMCRRYSVPLVEGGFAGPQASYAVFRNAPEDACWRCGAGEILGSIRLDSCDASGVQLRQAGVVPATQSVAAVLGGLMAEAVIQVLHQNTDILNRRIYFNIRVGKSVVAALAQNEACGAEHEPLASTPIKLELPESASIRALLAELQKMFSNPYVTLPSPLICCMLCERCGRPLQINRPLWTIDAQPLCRDDGGVWDCEPGAAPLVVTNLSNASHSLLSLTCATVGIVPGMILSVRDASGSEVLFEFPGRQAAFARANSQRLRDDV